MIARKSNGGKIGLIKSGDTLPMRVLGRAHEIYDQRLLVVRCFAHCPEIEDMCSFLTRAK
jgi:hypothetical protein